MSPWWPAGSPREGLKQAPEASRGPPGAPHTYEIRLLRDRGLPPDPLGGARLASCWASGGLWGLFFGFTRFWARGPNSGTQEPSTKCPEGPQERRRRRRQDEDEDEDEEEELAGASAGFRFLLHIVGCEDVLQVRAGPSTQQAAS